MEVEREARGKGSHCFPMKKSLLSNELFGVQLGEILRILHDISHCDAEKKSQGPHSFSGTEKWGRKSRPSLEMDRNSATSLLQYDDTQWRQIKKNQWLPNMLPHLYYETMQ